jgi:hypothetical protein
LRRQLERQAEPAVEAGQDAREPYKQAAARSAERSFAERAVVEQPALPQLAALAEHPRKPALPPKTSPQLLEQLAVLEEQQ